MMTDAAMVAMISTLREVFLGGIHDVDDRTRRMANDRAVASVAGWQQDLSMLERGAVREDAGHAAMGPAYVHGNDERRMA